MHQLDPNQFSFYFHSGSPYVGSFQFQLASVASYETVLSTDWNHHRHGSQYCVLWPWFHNQFQVLGQFLLFHFAENSDTVEHGLLICNRSYSHFGSNKLIFHIQVLNILIYLLVDQFWIWRWAWVTAHRLTDISKVFIVMAVTFLLLTDILKVTITETGIIWTMAQRATPLRVFIKN